MVLSPGRRRSARFPALLGIATVLTVCIPGIGQTLPSPTARPLPPAAEAAIPVEPALEQPTPVAPSYYAGEGAEPEAPRIEMGLVDTITDSLFGDVYAEKRWRPLSFGTFFSEGWLEPWAGAPAGRQGLAPRHGWLGAFDGVFYRLYLTTFGFSNNLNTSFGGNRYTGTYSIFLPFSRRFEVLLDTPFVVSNGTKDPTHGYTRQFGDLVVTPRFLLSETESTTQTFALGIRTPTGTTPTGAGVMSMSPRYEFWTNPVGPWVVRGAASFFVPMNKERTPVQTAYTGGLAVGRYFRPHDVPFGNLVFYAACNYIVPLDGGATKNTYVGIGPGTRFHITKNFFFLHYWEFPVTGNRPYDYTMQVALLKVF